MTFAKVAVILRNACINVKPEGGTPGICAAFDFSEEFLVK